jgi:hypothetical protein
MLAEVRGLRIEAQAARSYPAASALLRQEAELVEALRLRDANRPPQGEPAPEDVLAILRRLPRHVLVRALTEKDAPEQTP